MSDARAPRRAARRESACGRCSRELMLIPGLSGYEGRVRRYLAKQLAELGLKTRTDRLGNLIATLDGDAGLPVGDALRAYGPARLRRAQDRGGRPDPRRAARRRAGEGAAVAGGAASASAKGATCRASSPTRATTRRRRTRNTGSCPIPTSTSMPASPARDEALAAGIDIGTPIVYRAAGAGACRRPHRRHVGRRPRRLRRHRRGRARAAASAPSGRPCISSSRCRRSSTCAAR